MGEPISQGRMRVTTIGGFARLYDPCAKHKSALREQIANYVKDNYPEFKMLEHPRISFIFHMPIPKSIKKRDAVKYNSGLLKHEKKSDCDNLVKLSLDCLDGIVFQGDEKVSLGNCVKLYHREPKTIIFLTEEDSLLCQRELEPQLWTYLYSAESVES